MLFGTQPRPRVFNYRPRYLGRSERQKIKFPRLTLYDHHQRRYAPLVYGALILMALWILHLLGGVRPALKPVTVTPEDAAAQGESN